MALALLEGYEDKLHDAPPGGTLCELYDLDAGAPLPAYRVTYERVAAKLRGLGVPMQGCDG